MDSNIETILNRVKRVHLIGIGGVSMSALALILKHNNYDVSGSDINNSEALNKLRADGITIYIGHSPDNLNDTGLVVYTAAVREDNPELSEALKLGLPVFERAKLLGAVMKKYPCPIGVAGTHGKTTTTSMISSILLSAGKDPTITVGGNLSIIGGNLRIGKDEFFVFESCEYVDSFLNFYPKISVINNIDEDHLDYFKDLEAIIASFKKYTKNTLEGGTLIINAEDENSRSLTQDYSGKVITFGLSAGDFHAVNIDKNSKLPVFDVAGPKGIYAHISLRVFGEHNIKNACAACAAAYSAGIDGESAARGLYNFTGTDRRFQVIGEKDGVTVMDDYAHHPTEIETTLKTAKTLGYNRVVCAFQPHTYTRTKALLKDFIRVLSIADKTVLCDIYPAREEDIYNISSADIAKEIPDSSYMGSFENTIKYLESYLAKGDLLITMGAGDIYKVGRDYLKPTKA